MTFVLNNALCVGVRQLNDTNIVRASTLYESRLWIQVISTSNPTAMNIVFTDCVESDLSPDFTIMEKQTMSMINCCDTSPVMEVCLYCVNSLAWHSLLMCNWNLTVGKRWRCYAQVWNWFQVPPIPFLFLCPDLVHRIHKVIQCCHVNPLPSIPKLQYRLLLLSLQRTDTVTFYMISVGKRTWGTKC